MKTLNIDSKRELTVSLFKNRDNDTFDIKIRLMDGETLEKSGLIVQISHEALRRLLSVPEGKSYPTVDISKVIELLSQEGKNTR